MTTRKSDAGKKIDFRKFKKLAREAFLLVERDAKKITKALENGTSVGATMSKRLLFEMAEAGVDTELLEFVRTSSLAQLLAQEPQVPALPDEDVETTSADV